MDTDKNDEDEVIRELDVYVNDNLELYLLQFPLKPAYMDPPEIMSAKFKPTHRKLEITGGNTIPHMVGSSLPKTVNLAVGVIRDNAMHITPLNDIFQMRPSFEHFKPADDEFIVSDDEDEASNIKSKLKPATLQQVFPYLIPS